jgi:hypothetical protein
VSADDDTKSGSLMFSINGVDTGAFFPVEVTFVGKGSLAGVAVESISKLGEGETPAYSVDSLVTTDEYLVV